MRIMKCRVGDYATLTATVRGFVYCGRSFKDYPGSPLGNQFKASDNGLETCLEQYRRWLWAQVEKGGETLKALQEITEASVLGCWCYDTTSPGATLRCHCDVIARGARWHKRQTSRVDLRQARISEAQRRHLAKGQHKSDQADCLLATEGSNGATGEYLRLWREASRAVNEETQGGMICFVSANGSRRGRKGPPENLIREAATRQCTFLTDGKKRRPEGGGTHTTSGSKKWQNCCESWGTTRRQSSEG